ncbi:MAG: hypothetical protein AAGA68_05605 [Pseudomonadota bacterium]
MAERPADDATAGRGEDRAPEDSAHSHAAGESAAEGAVLPTPLAAKERPDAELADEDDPEYLALPGRWGLLRDAAAFQVKLVVDGLRDVLLSPLSLIAAIAGLALGRHEWFYDLLHLGRRTERWIDLFSAARRVGEAQSQAPSERAREAEHRRYYRRPPSPVGTQEAPDQHRENSQPPRLPEQPRTWYSDSRWSNEDQKNVDAESIDDLIGALESRLQEQYQRGGVTARAKHTIDRMLDAVEKRYREGQRTPPESDT